MNEPRPGGPLDPPGPSLPGPDLPGVDTRGSGLRGKTRLIVFAVVIIAILAFNHLRPKDKPLQPADSKLSAGPTGGLLFSNAKITMPLPAGWTLGQEQKPDELHLHDASAQCRMIILRDSVDVSPEEFQASMSKQMTKDGNRITPQSSLTTNDHNAARMHADLSTATEEIYTIAAGHSLYTIVAVTQSGCTEDMEASMQGFHVAP